MKFIIRTTLLTLCFFGFISKSNGTHIVGGEFEMVHQKDFNYTFNLILYFDDVNGNPDILQQENILTAYIFRKSNNTFVTSVTLNKISTSFVPYTNIECTIESLRTRKLIYTNTRYLSPQIFNEPEGYYIVWERCCRNNTIDNVVLVADNTVGQTFYMEFPPVVDVNGDPFVNSSPILFPPLSDYACVNQFYYVDFAGDDPDGDSIVYSMVNPLHSSTLEPVPVPTPSPHPQVPWIDGIGKDNQVPGDPPLSVSKDGLLVVTPSLAGLFVFSVKADEYRDGKKIGEVRRDFQMLVIDCPDPGSPPKISARVKGASDFYKEGEVITFKTEDYPKCLDLFVTDVDVPEVVSIRAKGVNFKADLSNIFSMSTSGVLANAGDTFESEVCLPDCPYTENQPMYIDLIAYDDACSLPLTDTLRIAIIVEPPANESPQFVQPLAENVIEIVKEGDEYKLPLKAEDADGDPLTLTFIPDGFDMEDFGMSFSTPISSSGTITSEFIWQTGCDIYDFTQRTQFDVFVLADDMDECSTNNADTLKLTLTVKLPTNNDPVVTSDLKALNFSAFLSETVNFNVFANDIDQDWLKLEMATPDFPNDYYKVNFESKEGQTNVSSPFSWYLDCELIDLNFQDEFKFYFIATDRDKCKFPNADTLEVNIKVLPPHNEAPDIFLSEVLNERTTVTVWDQVNFEVVGIDNDQGDSIYLELLDRDKYENFNFSFEDVKGVSRVSSQFSWTPDCSTLSNEFLNGEFHTFEFLVSDNYCIEPHQDTLKVEVSVKDVVAQNEDFLPPNVITPNSDGKNDYFEIPDLPTDNCAGRFEEINIFNRQGRRIFKDKSRSFRWFASGISTGVYYYSLKYSNRSYNGIISILR